MRAVSLSCRKPRNSQSLGAVRIGCHCVVNPFSRSTLAPVAVSVPARSSKPATRALGSARARVWRAAERPPTGSPGRLAGRDGSKRFGCITPYESGKYGNPWRCCGHGREGRFCPQAGAGPPRHRAPSLVSAVSMITVMATGRLPQGVLSRPMTVLTAWARSVWPIGRTVLASSRQRRGSPRRD
jgi:hypothetical protein